MTKTGGTGEKACEARASSGLGEGAGGRGALGEGLIGLGSSGCSLALLSHLALGCLLSAAGIRLGVQCPDSLRGNRNKTSRTYHASFPLQST